MTQDPAPLQLPLFADFGVDTLPDGMADLSAKQTKFVLAFLRTRQSATAAREAGYSDPEADGARIRRSPKVARVLTQVAAAAATSAVALIGRVGERSQAAHSDWQEARHKPEGLRSTKAEAELLSAVNATDKLLGGLIGLDTLKVQGEMQFHGLTADELATMRELQEGLAKREGSG